MIKIPEKARISNYEIEFRLLGRGRFREEFNYEVLIDGKRLCNMKVFHGRGFYRPWIELYLFTDLWGLLKRDKYLSFRFFKIFYCLLGDGNSLFIEYYHDRDIVKHLDGGGNVEDSWLGKILKSVGFTRFKDWYIPEGFMEGGQKIEVWREG